ncbi:MAG: hypothetical protein ACK4RG_08400 [Fimbriimonadales bacterium]
MRTPTSIKVIGIVGLVWGTVAAPFALLSGLAMLVLPEAFISLASQMFSPQYVQALENDNFRHTGGLVMLVQGGIALLLLIGSVQLLRLKPVGWRLMMIYVIAAIGWGVADRVLNATVYEGYRHSLSLSKSERPAPRALPGILFPAIAAYFLTRPKIAELYRQDWLIRED